MAASFLVAGLMLTPAPLNAFAENELTAVEAGQPSAEEQAPEAGKTTETTAQEDEQAQESAEQEQETGEQNIANPAAESPDQNQQQTAPVSSVAVDGEHAVGANSLSTVYVSQNGNDETGNGTADHPLKSLEWAVTAAAKDATINVMTDLDARNTARYYDKRLTIKSVNGTHTITRSKDFGHISDTARSWYNGGLIEVGSVTGANDASLTLESITLDDQGIHFTADKTGKKVYFLQAQNSGGNTHFGSEDINHMYIAQDSIIATYGGTANITLGNGATLKNFGGMSAVRMSGGKLTMMDGSKIVDDASVITDRIKGTEIAGVVNDKGEKDLGQYGPAGALWIQGGTVDMQKGSEISGIVGRAIYEDGGNVTVNGTISNIKGDGDMWQGWSGAAIHVRGKGKAVLGSTGVIDGVTGEHAGYRGAIVTNGSIGNGAYDFEAKQGSVIKNVTGFPTLFSNYGTELLNGTITDCTNDYIIGGFAQNTTIGKTGVIEKCTAKEGAAKAIVYTSNASKVFMSGTVRDNDSSYAFYIINQSGGGASLEMNDGLIQGKGSATGVYVNGANSQFTMNGGTLKGFSTGIYCRKKSTGYARFIMNGGTITGNSSYALLYSGSDDMKSFADIHGGTIEGNGSSSQISASGGNSDDTYERISIKPGVLKGNTTVSLSLGLVTLDSDYTEIRLGGPKTVAKEEIKKLVRVEHNDWDMFSSSALWFKPTTDKLHFTVNRPSMKKTGLFVAYIPLKEDGTPADNAVVTIKPVNNEPTVDVSLEGLTPNTSYALMFVNNNEYTLKPDATTVYVGGDQGKDGKANGLPVLSVANSIDKINTDGLEVDGNKVTGTSAELTAKLLDMLQVTYVDAAGKEIADDSQSGAYTAKLSWKGSKKPNIRINGNDVADIADGSLVVRHVSDTKAAKAGENVTSVVEKEPTEAIQKATAKKNSGYYLNGNSSAKVSDVSGIALMDDNPLLEGSAAREQALEDKVNEALAELVEGEAYRYDFHFLDLVDTNNGNAYVTNSSSWTPTTLYLPYPEGTNKNTDFQLVHVKGLNREYGINGQANVDDAIAASTAEAVTTLEKTNAGIKFTMRQGNFGLYALAWKTEAHTIKASVNGEGGTITPSGAVTVGTDASKTFDITPNEGYVIADVTVDGTSMGPVSRFTFEHVKEDHAIVASFRKAQHTITATAGEGGTIDPAGSVAVKDGGDQKFTITPNKGYKIADVKVDGQSVGKVASYTFAGVTADHVIEVTFEAEPVIPAHKHTWGDWQYDGKSHWHVCMVCGKTADKAAHTWGDWTVVTQATETADGLREHVCEVCGCKVQEVIPATGKKPGDKGENKDENKSDSKKDTDNKSKNELPATGDASSMVAVIAAAGAAATVAGAAALRKRDER